MYSIIDIKSKIVPSDKYILFISSINKILTKTSQKYDDHKKQIYI